MILYEYLQFATHANYTPIIKTVSLK